MAQKKIFLVQSIVDYPAIKIGYRSMMKYVGMLKKRTKREITLHPDKFPDHVADLSWAEVYDYYVSVRQLSDDEVALWRSGYDPADL